MPEPAEPGPVLFLDPEVKPPHYRVPRGRSGVGSQSALQTLQADAERIRAAREAYAALFDGLAQAVARH